MSNEDQNFLAKNKKKMKTGLLASIRKSKAERDKSPTPTLKRTYYILFTNNSLIIVVQIFANLLLKLVAVVHHPNQVLVLLLPLQNQVNAIAITFNNSSQVVSPERVLAKFTTIENENSLRKIVSHINLLQFYIEKAVENSAKKEEEVVSAPTTPTVTVSPIGSPPGRTLTASDTRTADNSSRTRSASQTLRSVASLPVKK